MPFVDQNKNTPPIWFLTLIETNKPPSLYDFHIFVFSNLSLIFYIFSYIFIFSIWLCKHAHTFLYTSIFSMCFILHMPFYMFAILFYLFLYLYTFLHACACYMFYTLPYMFLKYVPIFFNICSIFLHLFSRGFLYFLYVRCFPHFQCSPTHFYIFYILRFGSLYIPLPLFLFL